MHFLAHGKLGGRPARGRPSLPITQSPTLPHSQTRLGEEWERCAQYLDSGLTRKPLIAVVEKQLVEAHMGGLLERGFAEVGF